MSLGRDKIYSFLHNDLTRLEEYLKDFCGGLEGILRENVEATLLTGGKRIRPALFLICARNENYDLEYLLPAAASIEILHTASLIHDDIIDNAVMRRGRKTIHNVYDRDTAKFTGNYLFTQTFDLLNNYRKPEVLREMSSAAQNLVRGEFDQIKTRKILNQSESLYLKKINEKTSSLFKVSCALGGILSGSSGRDIRIMRKFGGYLGASFQINDDLLDIGLDKPVDRRDGIGKQTGNDLRQGNVTLPLIYALRRKNYYREIKKILDRENIGKEEVEKIFTILSKTDAIDRTRKYRDHYLSRARKIISKVGGDLRRQGLLRICDFFMEEVIKAL